MTKILELYDDQREVMGEVKKSMHSYKNILLQSATGSGKTAMATNMVINAVRKGKTAVFTVPRKDLLTQTSNTFTSYGISHSFVAAGKEFNPYAKAYCGMIDTMARRLGKLPNADLVIIDETHFGSTNLDKVIKHYKKKGSWIIGLSATPWKLSGQGLGIWYDYMVQGKSIEWLIDNKRLSDYRYFYGKTHLDLSGLKVSAGDYSKGQLADFMEQKRVIIGDCVSDYRERCMGRLHIVRCTSIKHSQMTAQAFRDQGIPFVHVDGNTPEDEKRRIFKAYARREILGLTFADLLNFGFDLSQASGMNVCIESASDLKPSKSLAGQMQFWGRALRYKEIPAIFNDHVNNHIEHMLPCWDRNWTLASRTVKSRESEASIPTKQCEKCFYVHKPAPSCPECGYIYEIKARKLDEIDGQLEEIDKASIKAAKKEAVLSRKKEQGEAYTLEDLIALGKKRGYKQPTLWASNVLASRMYKKR